MGNGYCFISYSNADALDFATRLAAELEGGQPFIKVWFDKNEMSSSADDWDEQIAAAIKDCKCLIFVMSLDSSAKGSNCKREWTWALRCKKPIICLLLDAKAEDQYSLYSRQKIDDFTSNFEAGIAKLRLAIGRLDSPAGALDQLNHRLADAKRDLQRARAEERGRIQSEIDELNGQIKRQEEIVRDPEAARKQTEANIQSGLERERQPEKPVGGKSATRFINPPPGVAPTYFQDRTAETKEVARFLRDDAQRLLTIVGRGGLGKTAMVCRLLKALESGALPDGLGDLKVDGIVYLSETGSHRVNFANLFAGLSQLLPAESAAALEALYRDPHTGPASKMRALLERFPDGKALLLLDNLEPLIDVATFDIGDAELDESLRAFLCGAHTGVKIILTTRIAPRGLNLCEPGRQRALYLDAGLETPYAENILREMDADGKLGLKTAPDGLLARAREATRGYPRALEALFAILASDRYTTLEEILAAAGKALPENVIQSLVGEAFSRLDGEAQQVMQALAVYNRPVSPAAVDYLLQPRAPGINSAATLNRLVTMQFARRESGRYYLHPGDREYAFSIIPVEDQKASSTKITKFTKENLKPFFGSVRAAAAPSQAPYALRITQYELLHRAADYFAQARKPREEWKKLDDLAAQLAEFDLRCAAGDDDTAANVLCGIDYDYLFLWGHYRLIIDLHEKISDNISDKNLRISNLNALGFSYRDIGQVHMGIKYFERGVSLAQDAKNRQAEDAFIGNLGTAYFALGDMRKAIEFYEQQLVIVREIGNKRDEGNALGNLGVAYANLGNARKTMEFYEQALVIAREIGDRRGEGERLGNLGSCYADLGDAHKAIEFYEQALMIAREVGNRSTESIILENTGYAFLSFEEYQKAEEHIKQAIQIANEISFQPMQQYGRWELSQVYLLQNDLSSARAAIETALQYDVPQYNHHANALLGIIALRQGERAGAQAAFAQSIAQADALLAKTPDFYDALDAKGLAVCGSAVSREWRKESSKERDEVIAEAVATFRAARRVASHAGVVKGVLRLFDELAKCDVDRVLVEARKAAQEIP